jgi:signal transduction histidine kinase
MALGLLTGKLFEAQEEERRRIARELHDGLNQQLAILAVELDMLIWKVPAREKLLRASLVTLRKRAGNLSDDLRNMTHQLHPAVLEHLGLIAALRSYCTEFSRLERIRVRFTAGQISGPPPEVSICLYRIVQEALRNVAKHSRAKEAWVRIMQDKEVIQLSIMDKGVGIHPDAVRDMPGLGLISIQERVLLVNGQLDISAPGRGTRITVRVPMKWKEETK